MRLVIIGGGISGLSLAYFLLERKPSLDIVILEAGKKAGGKIWTDKAEGFLCEGGVNGFLDNRPKTLELLAKLGLIPLRSNDNARKRYIFSDGKLHRLPESPVSFFSSDLLSFYGRLRILWEIFVPKSTPDDETLADFARRRLGKEAYEKLIDPMASGIYAGDPENMSLKSCFRRIYELEQKYGSLIKAMMKLQKEAKKTGNKVGPGPGGVLTSFYDGMELIISLLKNFLGERLKTNARVVSVDKEGEDYVIYISDGKSIKSEALVLAIPAYEASEMVKILDNNLSATLNEIFYPAVSVVCLGYKRSKIRHPLDGFGFLIPNREGKKILGTLWDSSVFPNRAPDGYVLLRTMLGGARMSGLALQDEDKQINMVMNELKGIMKIDAQPDFTKVYIHQKGIPQYSSGHERRLGAIDKSTDKFKKFYITGNAYRGIGVNDCIENSFKLAERIIEENP
ncbi:MAG: protoporphyrinogen oxidase [Nitrospirae bacterium]|jgi:protoporphyrinogen/coproporphyrinogen III oxidase|nr:protoporphyrinogen oxidase [Nitrospirota bacterium]